MEKATILFDQYFRFVYERAHEAVGTVAGAEQITSNVFRRIALHHEELLSLAETEEAISSITKKEIKRYIYFRKIKMKKEK